MKPLLSNIPASAITVPDISTAITIFINVAISFSYQVFHHLINYSYNLILPAFWSNITTHPILLFVIAIVYQLFLSVLLNQLFLLIFEMLLYSYSYNHNCISYSYIPMSISVVYAMCLSAYYYILYSLLYQILFRW